MGMLPVFRFRFADLDIGKYDLEAEMGGHPYALIEVKYKNGGGEKLVMQRSNNEWAKPPYAGWESGVHRNVLFHSWLCFSLAQNW